MDFLDFIRKVHKERKQGWIAKHYGSGPHPSGSPQSVHGKKGKREPRVQVGITSFKTEKGQTPKQMKKDMDELERELKKTGVKNLSVKLGTGGWEGGSEPTFVIQFEGDGAARKVLARKAKEWDQSAVIIMEHVKKGGHPQTRISFGEALTEVEYRAVERGLLDASNRHGAGMGGWTWGRDMSGHPVLIMQCIPKWGGVPDKHITASKDLLAQLKGLGYDASMRKLGAKVEVWEKEVGDYDEILAG